MSPEKGPFQKEQIFFQPAFSREFISFPEEVAQKSRAPPQKKTTHVLIKAIGSMGLVDLFAWMIDFCSKCIGRYTNVPWMRSWERTFHGNFGSFRGLSPVRTKRLSLRRPWSACRCSELSICHGECFDGSVGGLFFRTENCQVIQAVTLLYTYLQRHLTFEKVT